MQDNPDTAPHGTHLQHLLERNHTRLHSTETSNRVSLTLLTILTLGFLLDDYRESTFNITSLLLAILIPLCWSLTVRTILRDDPRSLTNAHKLHKSLAASIETAVCLLSAPMLYLYLSLTHRLPRKNPPISSTAVFALNILLTNMTILILATALRKLAA